LTPLIRLPFTLIALLSAYGLFFSVYAPLLHHSYLGSLRHQEYINSYTELNDPLVQRERFTQQAKDREEGDEEAQLIDFNFCKSLEFGLPPTAGWGLGIDRLVALLAQQTTIKEVIFFPAMKDQLKPTSSTPPT
jgi:hypothetical protein